MFNALAKTAPEVGFHVPDEPSTVDTSRHAAIIRFRRFRWDLDTCNDSSFRLFSSSRFPGPARRDPNTTRAFSTRVSASAVVVGSFGEKGSVGGVVAGGCGTPGGRGFAG